MGSSQSSQKSTQPEKQTSNLSPLEAKSSRSNSTISIRNKNQGSVITKQNTISMTQETNQSDETLDAKILELFEETLLNLTNCHFGITCDYCQKENFRDFRYKCILCKDYDLCGDCFEHKRGNKSHQSSHPVLLLIHPIPSSKNSLLNKLIQVGPDILKKIAEENVFEGVQCDVCGLNPIKGLRIRCDECKDYDLCWECYTLHKISKSHLTRHTVVVELFPSNMKYFNVDSDIKVLQGDEKSGCFGSVKKVLYKSKQIAALKKITIDQETGGNASRLLKSYKNELNAYNELRSTNIIGYYGTSASKKGDQVDLYLLTEFMDNGSLEEVIREKQDQSFRRRFQWILAITKGIRRIHEKGFVHKDIKPDNILLDKYWEAKIGDMGIAIHNEGGHYFYEQIAPRQYAAPEILRGEKFTNKADIFSLGLLINELFTYKGHRRGLEVQFLERTKFFWPLVEKCVQSNYKSRPSAEQIEERLEQFDKYFWKNLSMTPKEYIRLKSDEKNVEFARIYDKAVSEKILEF